MYRFLFTSNLRPFEFHFFRQRELISCRNRGLQRSFFLNSSLTVVSTWKDSLHELVTVILFKHVKITHHTSPEYEDCFISSFQIPYRCWTLEDLRKWTTFSRCRSSQSDLLHASATSWIDVFYVVGNSSGKKCGGCYGEAFPQRETLLARG